MAKSRKPLQTLWIKKRRSAGRGGELAVVVVLEIFGRRRALGRANMSKLKMQNAGSAASFLFQSINISPFPHMVTTHLCSYYHSGRLFELLQYDGIH